VVRCIKTTRPNFEVFYAIEQGGSKKIVTKFWPWGPGRPESSKARYSSARRDASRADRLNEIKDLSRSALTSRSRREGNPPRRPQLDNINACECCRECGTAPNTPATKDFIIGCVTTRIRNDVEFGFGRIEPSRRYVSLRHLPRRCLVKRTKVFRQPDPMKVRALSRHGAAKNGSGGLDPIASGCLAELPISGTTPQASGGRDLRSSPGERRLC
jgi:hypothetical protein